MQNIISKLSKDAKIAVLAGGMSSEREISMRSGKGCFEALKRLGFINAELVEVDKNIAETLKLGNFDAAYNALHPRASRNPSNSIHRMWSYGELCLYE